MSLKGPAPKPLDELSYSRRKRREKEAKQSEPITELPAAPDFLSASACAIWIELGRLLVEQGVLCQTDLSGFAALVSLTAQRQELSSFLDTHGAVFFDGSKDVIRPEHTILKDTFAQWFSLLTSYGLTPASRGRVPRASTLTLHKDSKHLKFFAKKS